ncbi:MAG TPA: DHH family phosphoesterase [Bacillota bacterium]|nr:DHH family phosphoesterase [Bacillota bacterium]
MSDHEKKITYYSIIKTHLIPFIILLVVWYYSWVFGLIMTILLGVSLWYTFETEKKRYEETQRYISSLSYRVKRAGEEALLEMPIGIILYSEDFEVEWSNPFMNQFTEDETYVGKSLQELSEQLIPNIKEDKEDVWISIEQFYFQVTVKKEERLLYFFDRTKQKKIERKYDDEQTVIGVIFLDNYEEVTRNMEDAVKSELNSTITSTLNHWAQQYRLYLKRTSQERFLAVGTNDILEELEETRFNILDKVRELENEKGENNPVTLSMGIGYGDADLPALGELAQSSLDLALGRGGDQVAIKSYEGKVRFYGGKTNPMEKRTRVRARVISHALRDLVKASDNVIIMGHKTPDMDSIGASLGVLNIAQANEVDGFIVFDSEDLNSGISRMIKAIQEEDVWESFITSEEAEEQITSKSLIVIVDTHKPSLVANERLLKYTDYKVVIDHHRRSEDFIDDPTLVYMEPYASSTCELVTELLEYQPSTLKLSRLEATCMLAGIIVDTKSFTLRTGSRTFDAASYLRARGADTVLVQTFMKEDFEQYLERSNLIKRAKVYRDSIAIAVADEGEVIDHILIAQAADTLLTMNGINASFVISERDDGRIGISARSLGDVNVQIIMEQMEGGGHLTNAATQLEDTSIHEAEKLLKETLRQYFEGRDE